jgi:uncharacterized RDD family membrane protein YckC
MSDSSALPTAGVIRRLAALVYDAFLLFGLLVVPLLILTAATQGGASSAATESVTHELPGIAPKAVLQMYWLVVVVGFYCYFWRKNGQTLGMQAWRLRLDSNAGGRPSWRQCGLRLLAGAPALLLGGLGYWWAWLDPQHRTWHDRASDTRVVILPKQGTIRNYA